MEVFYTDHASGEILDSQNEWMNGLKCTQVSFPSIHKKTWRNDESKKKKYQSCFRCWIWLVWRSQSFNQSHFYVECAFIIYYLNQTWRQVGVIINLGITLIPFSVTFPIGSHSIFTAVTSINNTVSLPHLMAAGTQLPK